ncbi:MAG: hypothetical protein K9I34_02210 [Bacteroidales bacterium]|nr:hypothetical protein [Bacteroidales bacterium]
MRKLILSVFCVFISTFFCSSQTPQSQSIDVSVSFHHSPFGITLQWAPQTGATSIALYRKSPEASAWTSLTSLGGSGTTYTDYSAASKIGYEYKIQVNATTTKYAYIYAGEEIPAVHYRGKVILLVDNTYINDLQFEIDRLILDLIGDGWQVLRHNVSRTEQVPVVKEIIKADYLTDPANVNSLFILGHIPVPYSGNMAPDGHSADHTGAWPADVYYGDMTGIYTDVTVNNSTASRTQNRNIPGDGKFDQSTIPGTVALGVGRVDLYNMPAFSSDDKILIKNYLDKDHAFRIKENNPHRKAIVDDNFGYFNSESFATSGWRSFYALLGADSTSSADYFTSMTNNSYIWSYGCGGGSYTNCNGVGSTTNFATNSVKNIFTMLFGSYFGDWDNSNNLLRAPLASNGWTLTNCWSGRPYWLYHHMGLGLPIGFSARVSQRFSSTYVQNIGVRNVHIALMGDPTLRMHIVSPPDSLQIAGFSNNSSAQLTWIASSESVSGYYVYRADSLNGIFTLLTQTPLTTTNYIDITPSGGLKYYMIRAVKLEDTHTGSYYNLSQGIIDTVTISQVRNAMVGTGFGTNDWVTFDYFNQMSGLSVGAIYQANATGNQYFRIGVDWSDGQHSQHIITPGMDSLVEPESQIVLNSTPDTDGSMYLHVLSTSDNYVFKTKNAGIYPTFDLIIFRVEGEIRTVSSVSNSPEIIYPGQPVTITANLSGILANGQAAYVHYSKDNWTSSSMVEMVYSSGNQYTGTIPTDVNIAGAEVSYYVFTSGDSLTVSPDDVDWYAINLNDNDGNNYSYSVGLFWTTKVNATVWSNPASWDAGSVPLPGQPVWIEDHLILDQDASVSKLLININKTFTASYSTARTLTITDEGSLINNGTFSANGGKVVFSGDGIVAGSLIFNDVEILGGVDFGSASSISGTLSLNGGWNAGTSGVLFKSGSILRFEESYEVGSTDKVWMPGIVSTGLEQVGVPWNVEIMVPATVNLNHYQPFYMNGSLTINGTFRLGTAANPYFGDIYLRGNLIDNGTFLANNRAVFFNGTAIQTMDGSSITEFENLNIVNGSQTNIASSKFVTINDCLHVASNSAFTIYSGASLITPCSINNEGVVNVEKSFTDNLGQYWHFMSTPVSGMNITGSAFAPGANDDFYAWDGSSPGTWVNFKTDDPAQNPTFVQVNGSTNFIPGRGYLVAFNNTSFSHYFSSSALTTGTLNVSLSYNATKATDDWNYTPGWNLLGNPYTSGIDWNLADRSKFQDDYAYIYDPNKIGGEGYITVDGSATGAYMGPTQGFFVLATPAANNTNFSFTSAMQVHASTVYKNSENGELIKLRLSRSEFYDEITLRFREGSAFAREHDDALKLYSFNTAIPQLFSYSAENIELSVNTFALEEIDGPVALGVIIPENGSYLFSLDEEALSLFPEGVLLEDTEAGIIHNLLDESYSFESESGTFPNRFKLYVRFTDLPPQAPDDGIHAWVNNNILYIEQVEEPITVTLTSMSGLSLLCFSVPAHTSNWSAPLNLKSGVYGLNLKSSKENSSFSILILD